MKPCCFLQLVFEARDRVELAPLADLVFGSITRQIRAHRVIAIAIRQRLDQARPVAFARARDRFLHRRVHRQHIVAVHCHTGIEYAAARLEKRSIEVESFIEVDSAY